MLETAFLQALSLASLCFVWRKRQPRRYTFLPGSIYLSQKTFPWTPPLPFGSSGQSRVGSRYASHPPPGVRMPRRYLWDTQVSFETQSFEASHRQEGILQRIMRFP
jgi:hypothetical protein